MAVENADHQGSVASMLVRGLGGCFSTTTSIFPPTESNHLLTVASSTWKEWHSTIPLISIFNPSPHANHGEIFWSPRSLLLLLGWRWTGPRPSVSSCSPRLHLPTLEKGLMPIFTQLKAVSFNWNENRQFAYLFTCSSRYSETSDMNLRCSIQTMFSWMKIRKQNQSVTYDFL